MKKLSLLALVMAMSFLVKAQSQKSILLNQDFWKEKPELEAVKAEVAKGFDFKNVQGSDDPVYLAINNDAPAAAIKYLIDQPGVDLTRKIHEGRIYLHIAVFKGNAEISDYLLSKGSDMYLLDANGHTALTYPAIHGKLTAKVVDVFIKHGLDINKKYESKDGANLLLLGISYDKDLSLTNYLVSKGLSINSVDNEGNSAFYYAAKIGDIELMKTLVNKGIKYDKNSIIAAAQGTYRTANKLEVYQYLVDELKLDPFVTSKNGQNVLQLVTRKQNQADVVKYFLSKGVDANKTDTEGNTPFINAASGRSLETVELLFPKVKNINSVNSKGESALLAAVKSSTGDVVTFLMKNGADVNVKDKEGNGLAYYWIQSYRPQGGKGRGFGGNSTAPQQDDFGIKLKVLRENGVDFAKPQPDGSTLYHLAAAKNDLTLFKKLEGLGIDVNAKDKEGTTALHKAAMFSKDDSILKYLLSIGAKKNVATEFGETPYDLAKENENLKKSNISVEFLK